MKIPPSNELPENRTLAFHLLNKLFQSVVWTNEFADGTLFVFKNKYEDRFISINGNRIEFHEE